MPHDVPTAGELDTHRSYLRLLAASQLPAELRPRVAPSDVVQQTLVEAHEGLDRFRGRTKGELVAWLRRILARNLANTLRDQRRQRRAPALERSIEASIDRSSTRLAAVLRTDDSTPSEQVVRHEELARVAAILEELPEEQRAAIVAHYLQGRSLAAISRATGCSKYLVTQRLRKGLQRLRRGLGADG